VYRLFNESAGRAGTDQAVLQQNQIIPLDPFDHILFSIVMRDKRNRLSVNVNAYWFPC